MKPNPHWLLRARMAHQRLATDGGQQENSDPITSGYSVAREVAQFRLLRDRGHITQAEFEAARERLERMEVADE